jgi:hypothetical protein
MQEESVIRENLMTEKDYTPYCGSMFCKYHSPRSVYDQEKEQFTCKCGWVSKFPADFIKRYRDKWSK